MIEHIAISTVGVTIVISLYAWYRVLNRQTIKRVDEEKTIEKLHQD